MSKLITFGSELIRINPSNNHIEYSNNKGYSWYSRHTSSSCGTFVDLVLYENEIIALTSKGIYYSNNKGYSWYSRCASLPTSSYGTFLSLMDGGKELLAQTSKCLCYSPNKGFSWYKRS